jgi:antitoxin component HigA of HigAB toxin-antitoxin module
MNATKPTLPSFTRFPKTYEALCRLHMPRTLHDKIELDAVTEIIDLMAGHPLTTDQADYLETLSELAGAYESANYPAPPSLPPHVFLTAHLENIGMTATEWGKLIGIDRSTASRLLRGERKFSTAHVRKTAEALGIDPSHLI